MTSSLTDPSHSPPAGRPRRLALGLDAGKVTTCLALAELGEQGEIRILETRAERHLGDPLRPFRDLYATLPAGELVAVAATGVFGDRLGSPALGGLPEEIAQEQAAAWLYPDGPLNVVRVGGGGYSVLTRDAKGRVRYEANERCSAGTGETVEGLCSRLGRDLQEAVTLAQDSRDAVIVTSRCAVFAKSELTHFANQGESHGRIFRGLFSGVARNVHSLYDKSKVEGPVLLVGHGALIAPIAEGISALTPAAVTVAAEAAVFEALGALRYAAMHVASPAPAFPASAAALVQPRRRRITRLAPAGRGAGSVVRLETPPVGPSDERAPAVLGLDLGSTGSKAALLDAATGALLASVYRRTEGNPVEAAQALVAQIGEMAPNPVMAVGLTGSGRDAAASVFRAAYPEAGLRLTVQNEIVAHALAASRLDPDGGRSLSIVEIGGQDAKFINVEGGRVVDADMNRVCSAGTGSFLEEQAVAHGVADIAEFGGLAARSEAPPDLGQTCTVFVADVAAEALGDGFAREDIFAGLQHSVVRNYRSRVMGQRRLLGRVFFQGKPASDPSLARTLAAVLERDVYVPPDPGAMGAIGIGLLAAEALALPGEDAQGPPFDLAWVLEARVGGRREFQCKDRDCRNLCRLELAEIDVAGSRQKVVSGGQCPKYDAVSAAGEKLPKDAPNPFREREELLQALLDEEDGRIQGDGGQAPLRLGLPYAHYLVDTLPFFHTFLRRLGHEVEVLRPGDGALAEGDRRCGSPGACTPVKLLHGLALEGVDVLVAPVFVHLPLPNAGSLTYTCPMAQGAPDMVGRALSAAGSPVRVLRPVLFEKEGEDFSSAATRRALQETARALAEAAPGRSAPTAAEVRRATDAALLAQCRFEAGLRAIGEQALRWSRTQGRPVVLVAGETHVIHDSVLDAGIHDLVAANGAVPLPVDCYPVPDDLPGLRRVHWATAGQTLRAVAAGIEAGDVFPLLLGAYGCGPNSMIEHLVDDVAGDWPHAVLESDGHGGKAGYVTRVQAFLHNVKSTSVAPHKSVPSEAFVRGWSAGHAERGAADVGIEGGARPACSSGERLARYDRPLPHSLDAGQYDRFFFGHIGGGLGKHLAAAMRGAGFDATYVGEADAEALRAAGAVCSGKECLPYQLIWGTLARFLREEASLNGHRALFLSAGSGFQACRANLFPFTQQIALDRLGQRVDVADFSLVTSNLRMMPVVWTALVAVDLLNMLRFHALADEGERGAADRLFAAHSERLERMLERPRPDAGLAGNVRGAFDFCDEVEGLLAGAARDFRALPRDESRAAELRDVYLCGDIYLRVDEWGNDDLQRKLADNGLRVIFEPFGEFFELLQLRQIQDGLPLRKRTEKELLLRTMGYIIGRLLAVVRRDHPWAFWHDVREVDRVSRRLTSGYPFGETIPTIGSALLAWERHRVDGIVSVAPRGCGPALIAEAQLRREPGLPALFVYNDGDPIDEARLAGFAWRLRGTPARRL